MKFNGNQLDNLKYGVKPDCCNNTNYCNYNNQPADNSLKYFLMFIGFMMLLFFSVFALIIINA